MTNPFRPHRGDEDIGRRHEPERREGSAQYSVSRHGEGRSWRDDERPDRMQSSAGYGQRGADWAAPGYDVSRDPVYGAYDQRADRSDARQGGEGQGYERALQRSRQSGEAYPRHAYAPGSQIWEDTGREWSGVRGMQGGRPAQEEFEPDYLHWREQQLSAFDNDYRSWRDERRQKFSTDFDTWRSSRPKTEMKAEAANPIVGDVSDGGVGRDDLKNKN